MRLSRLRAIAVAVAVIAVAPSAHAQPAEDDASPAARAEEHFKRARQLYDEGDFTLSLVEFQRAYDISPNYRVLFNIGQVDIQLYNYAAARTALERYLRDGGGEIPEGRRAQVEQDLEMLRKRTAHLRIRTSPAGGDVAIDDVPVAPAALADEILVNAGRRKVVVTLAGHTPVTRIVTLAGGDHSELAIALAPLQVETAKPAVVTPPQAEEPKKSYTPAIVGWSTTAALAIGTGVVGGLYLSKQSDIDKLSDPARPVTKQEADDATAGADRLAVAADVLGLATLVTACISVYFTVKPPKSEPSGTRAASVRILPGGVGGTF